MSSASRIATTLLLVLASIASASAEAPSCWCRLENVRPHDADTLKADVVLPFGDVVLRGVSVRSDFDVWEITRTRKALRTKDKVTGQLRPLNDEEWLWETAQGRKSLDAFNKLREGGDLYISPPDPGTFEAGYGRETAKWLLVKDGKHIDLKEHARREGWLRDDERLQNRRER